MFPKYVRTAQRGDGNFCQLALYHTYTPRALCAVAVSKSIGHTKGVQSFSVRGAKQLENLLCAISVRMPDMQNKHYGTSSATAAAAAASRGGNNKKSKLYANVIQIS